MSHGIRTNKYPYFLLALYASIYAGSVTYFSFITVYFDSVGLNKTQIGILMAVGPIISIFSQPFWGRISDNIRIRNNILKLLFLASASAMLLYKLFLNFYYMILISVIFAFFHFSIIPICDTITLEYLQGTSWKYGPIRMSGTISAAFFIIGVGFLAKQNINLIFPIYAGSAILALILVHSFPIIESDSEDRKIDLKTIAFRLLRKRGFVILITFFFIMMIIFSFFISFFPIHFNELGADNSLLGWANCIAIFSEIPFLIFAEKIYRKLGIHRIFIYSAFISGLRWLLLGLVKTTTLILAIQLLHGFSFITFTYSIVIYTYYTTPKKLRSSGQSLIGVIRMGIASMSGNFFGGLLSDMIGIRKVFFYSSLLVFTLSILLYSSFKKIRDSNIINMSMTI